MPYITKEEVAAFLNITLQPGGEEILDQTIPAIEAYTNSYCNRSWGGNTVQTEVFDGGGSVFLVKLPRITSIVSVVVDGTILSSSDYQKRDSYIRLLDGTATGYQNVVITYNSSATLPQDVKHALIRWAGEISKSAEDAGKTAKSAAVGSVEVDFLAQDGMPKFVEMVLNRYRLHPV